MAQPKIAQSKETVYLLTEPQLNALYEHVWNVDVVCMALKNIDDGVWDEVTSKQYTRLLVNALEPGNGIIMEAFSDVKHAATSVKRSRKSKPERVKVCHE